MPTPSVWRRVCRKLKELEEIKESPIATVPTSKNFKIFDNEITMLCGEIRSSGILNFVHLFSTIKSIDGKDLDSSLAEVKYIAKNNYENYKNNFFETGMYNAKILQPIFVTNEERVEFENIENKTKAYIIQEINNMLDAFPNKDHVLTRKKEIKNSLKHHQLISMFYDVKSIFEELSLTMEIEELINEEFDV